ncbi:hypothetical protein KY289_011191 [Solanum tuberosum]|nr:hypothetical protein KY289_011191 [Solanum tuberosum]
MVHEVWFFYESPGLQEDFFRPLIKELKQELNKSFAMKDLGPTRQILGIQIVRDRDAKKLWLSQEMYIQKVLRRFNMDNTKVINTPLAMHFKLSIRHCPSTDGEKKDMKKVPYALAVGSLMYAMVCTRPDIAHVPILCGYTDSDMAGDVDTRKSTSCYLITFVGGAVSWQSRDFWGNLVVLKRGMCFIAIVKVLFILARILHFMLSESGSCNSTVEIGFGVPCLSQHSLAGATARRCLRLAVVDASAMVARREENGEGGGARGEESDRYLLASPAGENWRRERGAAALEERREK